MASEYYKWLARDVKPEEEKVLTKAERRRNWWYYYKYHVLFGAVLVVIGISLVCSWLGIGKTRPDYAIAYVGTRELNEETAAALQTALAEFGRDENGDGEIYIAVNQYVSYSTGDSDSLYYAQAANAQLIADITSCDSYFFLLEDPEEFQENTHALRRLDGSLPADDDFSAEGTCIPVTELPALADALGEDYADLFLARRGFWTEDTTDHLEGCDAMWRSLTAR